MNSLRCFASVVIGKSDYIDVGFVLRYSTENHSHVLCYLFHTYQVGVLRNGTEYQHAREERAEPQGTCCVRLTPELVALLSGRSHRIVSLILV